MADSISISDSEGSDLPSEETTQTAPESSSAEQAPFVETAEDRKRSLSLIFSLWIPGSIIAYLLGAFPYAHGYLYSRMPITDYLDDFWKLPDWEHCFIVPMAVAFMIYEKRKELSSIQIQPSLILGGMVSFIGFFFYFAGYRADNYYFGYISIQILLAGMVLSVLGVRYMGALLFMWLFLGFMWPLLFLEQYLAFPLRQIMSEASVQTLNLIGIPTIKQGTGILSAPDHALGLATGQKFSVDVANPCSGIRSLFALLMVSALYAFFTFKSWWKQIILVVCAVPLAILGNLMRILMLTIGTLAFGAEFAIGTDALEDPSTFHMASGFLVFAVALGGMLLVAKVLNSRLFGFFEKKDNPPAAKDEDVSEAAS
ncbi:MAG: exosortase/archaeosortase family protein [Chthoniobacterales bacterium]